MKNNWHSIWSSRQVAGTDTSSLEALLRLDGWDSEASHVSLGDWHDYVESIASKLSIKDGDSVFEVGCGAGAFLVSLSSMRDVQTAGLDYSEPLVGVARRALPNARILQAEALDIPDDTTYDFAIANGVFHYFPLDYAERVLTRMLKVARRGVAVLEVPNARTRDESEKERARLIGQDYEAKYAGLEHTYFDPHWFEEKALKAGDWQVESEAQSIRNYAQNRYRFNAFIKPAQQGRGTAARS